MSSEDNVKAVQTIYEAFTRGDVATVLEALSDDVDWAAEAWSTDHPAPWWGVRHGKAEVGAFFEAFGGTIEVEDFTPTLYAANGDDVLSIVRFRGKSRATGRTEAMDLHHHFRFRDGKIVYYRGTEDSSQTQAVLEG